MGKGKTSKQKNIDLKSTLVILPETSPKCWLIVKKIICIIIYRNLFPLNFRDKIDSKDAP